MKQLVTEGIILSRTDYGEADRILTLLTPDHGKVRLLAKGVRRVKSKLAGGIELFSVSTITFVKGRGDIGTLVSTRLVTHYGHIVQDLERTMMGYDLIKLLNKATEDEVEADYFKLLQQAFAALDDPRIALPLVRAWFLAQLLRLSGHSPNLQSDVSGATLQSDWSYEFDVEAMALRSVDHGWMQADQIKFLRLLFAGHKPQALSAVQGSERLALVLLPLLATMQQSRL